MTTGATENSLHSHSSSELYANLPTFVPQIWSPTLSARPDLILIKDSAISLLKLTVPTNTTVGLSEAKQ